MSTEVWVRIVSSLIGIVLAAFISYFFISKLLTKLHTKQEEKVLQGNYQAFLLQFKNIKKEMIPALPILQSIEEDLKEGQQEQAGSYLKILESLHKKVEQINESHIPVNVYKPFLQLKSSLNQIISLIKDEKNPKQMIKAKKEMLEAFNKIENFALKVQNNK